MEQIVKSNSGNFAFEVTLNLTPEVTAYLVDQGAKRLLQGPGVGAFEREFWPKNAKGNPERPEKFNRKDIPFSQENADKLVNKFADMKIAIEDEEGKEKIVDLGVMDSTVTEYTPTLAEPKYKAAKDLVKLYLTLNDGKLKDGSPRSVESFATIRGLAQPTEPWEEDSEFLAAVTAWQKARDAKED